MAYKICRYSGKAISRGLNPNERFVFVPGKKRYCLFGYDAISYKIIKLSHERYQDSLMQETILDVPFLWIPKDHLDIGGKYEPEEYKQELLTNFNIHVIERINWHKYSCESFYIPKEIDHPNLFYNCKPQKVDRQDRGNIIRYKVSYKLG